MHSSVPGIKLHQSKDSCARVNDSKDSFSAFGVYSTSLHYNFFSQIHEMKPSSRILIMSQSIDGLTTNLQSLAFFARSMEHLHITLGFCLLRPKRLVSFGQKIKGNKGWVFYNLQTLRKNITGAVNNPRYMRLVSLTAVMSVGPEELRPSGAYGTLQRQFIGAHS